MRSRWFPRRGFTLGLSSLVFTLVIAATSAIAGVGGRARAQWSLDLRAQAQVSVASGMTLDPVGFGVVELGGEASLFGLGVVTALGFERVPSVGPAPLLRGGYMLLGLEVRPLVFVDRHLYRRVDLQVLLGGRFGAVTDGNDTDGRRVFALGLGLDVGLNDYGDSQWFLSLRYRFEPRRPYDASGHLLVAGLGFRFLEGDVRH